METITSIENTTNKSSIAYFGFCPKHDWEGFRRDEYSEAAKDLEGHEELFPDEDHSGSEVREE